MSKIYSEAVKLRTKKNKLYQDSWKTFGSKGQLIYLVHKVDRLKVLLWDKVEVPEDERFESAEDTLYDIIVVAAHCLILLEEEKCQQFR